MHVEVGDRLVLHGQHGTRIGVVVEGEEGGAHIRWADGGESVLSTRADAPESAGHATWEAAKAGPAVGWRRGVTAGVGHEASLRQEKLAEEAVADEKPAVAMEKPPVSEEAVGAADQAEERPDHKPAAGE